MQYPTPAEGIGIRKGRQEDRQETQRESLEQLLATRFGRLPAAVTARWRKRDQDICRHGSSGR